MNKKKISVVITDLDNTLYDWFKVWHSSFKAMLDSLVIESGISEEELIPQIKRIHEQHGTSEYLMLLNELPILQEKHPNQNIAEIYKNAIEAYKQTRKDTLELYPSVLSTLHQIKKSGCLIVGYTDSQALYTAYRVKELGLDGIFDFLYSSPNHELNGTSNTDDIHFFPSTNHVLNYTIHRQTPENASKPNPAVLIGIIEDLAVSAHEVIYVGDSILNDISMAQAVPVTDIHARYGTSNLKDEYELLKKVTHWKSEKVQQERDIVITPSLVLTDSFAQILDLFNFVQYKDAEIQAKLRESKEKEETIVRESKQREHEFTVDIWKKTIDVQQHFNDLELRIRNFAFTVLGVLISAAAVALKEYETSYLSWILVLVALGLWGMFFVMDYYWYHRLLIGSVKHGTKIEDEWGAAIPALGLTKAISKSSPIITKNKTKIGSSARMKVFYGGISILLGVLTLAFFITWLIRTPKSTDKPQIPPITVINNSQFPINTSIVNTDEKSNSSPSNANSNPVNIPATDSNSKNRN